MAKKIPQRMCVSCREMQAKNDLLRLVDDGTGLVPDPSGKKHGRGMYLCNSEACRTAFLQPRSLSKVMQRKVSAEESAVLQEQIAEASRVKASLTAKKSPRKDKEPERVKRVIKVKTKAATSGEEA